MLQNAFCLQLQDMLNTAGMQHCTAKQDSAQVIGAERSKLAEACFCSSTATATVSAIAIMSCNAYAHECNSFGAQVLNA